MSQFEDLREMAGCTCPPDDRQNTRAVVVCKRCGASAEANNLSPMHNCVVDYRRRDSRPPKFAIDHAVAAALQSPCQHSNRGVSFYRMIDAAVEVGTELVEETYASGANGPPWTWNEDDPETADCELPCDGSEACQRDCARRCVHAEQRAIMDLTGYLAEEPSRLRMVHVKIERVRNEETGEIAGRVVPGKGPCCVECSKLILDRGIGGVWLYQARSGVWFKDGKSLGSDGAPGEWVYYPAKTFHELSMSACGVYHIRSARDTPVYE